MSEKELQTLAQTFAEETNNDLKHKDFAEAFGMKFWQWLSDRFALVEKSKLADLHEDVVTTYLNKSHITFDGWFYIMEHMFGRGICKELFEEEEK